MVHVKKSNWTPPLGTGRHIFCCHSRLNCDSFMLSKTDGGSNTDAASRSWLRGTRPCQRSDVAGSFLNFGIFISVFGVFCLLSNSSFASLPPLEQSKTNQNHFDCWLAYRPRLHCMKFDSTTLNKYGKIYYSRSMCMSHSLLSLLTLLFLRCFYLSKGFLRTTSFKTSAGK